MPYRRFSLILFGLATFTVLVKCLFVLPSYGSGVFMSPDETANAIAARSFAFNGTMRIEQLLLPEFPWLRPRSFVTQGDAMVPVGFLGLAMLLGIFRIVLGEFGLLYAIPLLVCSASIPLWRFARGFGRLAQIATVVIWLSFPTVVLYANRALFPNLPVVALALWSCLLLWESPRQTWRLLVSGCCAGAAAAIRPVEIIWLIPWVVVAWMLRTDAKSSDRRLIWIWICGCAIPVIGATIVARFTYGSWGAIGYALRDTGAAASIAVGPPSVSVAGMWPFGIHPRNVLFNIRSYVLGLWGPWTLLTLSAVAMTVRKRSNRPFLWLGILTLASLVGVYGQAVYQDHVGVNVVSTGNSFLRYLLPLVPFFALSGGAVVALIERSTSVRRTRVITTIGLLVLVGYGLRIAFVQDGESLISVLRERERYERIQSLAVSMLPPETAVLSERSDKLFFPRFRVASPMPPVDELHRLSERAPVALYLRTLSETDVKAWSNKGLPLMPLFQSGNETLYLVWREPLPAS